MEMCKCGGNPQPFKTRSGGNGIRCDSCQREYSHPDFTPEQMERIWDWRMRGGEDDGGK